MMRIRLPVVLRIGGPAAAVALILLFSWLGGGDTWILIRTLINLLVLAIVLLGVLLALRSLTKLAAQTYARERSRLEEQHSERH
jgi:hypothetical protein